MNDEVWKLLGNVLLAALLGTVGQLVRVVAGLKKLNDLQNRASPQANGVPNPSAPAAQFQPSLLLTSLGIAIAIGAIAGVLSSFMGDYIHTKQAMLATLGAGYSGTDFIEAFMKKAVPGS